MNYPFTNPPLPYAYDALEPYIDTLTMHLHHDRSSADPSTCQSGYSSSTPAYPTFKY